jgi:HD-GYP domain-containing protein (c-di-GMP phosphodiesterase class II)
VPLLLQVGELQPGMRLAENVMRNFNILIPRGHTLSEQDIKYLERICSDNQVSIIDPNIDNTIASNTSRVRQLTPETCQKLQDNFSAVARKAQSLFTLTTSFDPEKIKELEQIIGEMLIFLQENPSTINILEQSIGWHGYLRDHGMQVFYYSTILGFAIQDHLKKHHAGHKPSSKGLRPLSTAALFHDVGMVPIQHLYDKTQPLDENDWKAIKAHSIVGVELIPTDIDPNACLAILQHHENYDGSGYSEGLKENNISILARIIRIVDSYTAATTNKKYRPQKTPFNAIYEMIYGSYRSYYDPGLLKLFCEILSPLPTGAKLQLENGQCCVVTRQNVENPFNPQVILAFDENGKSLPKRLLSKPFFLDQKPELKVSTFGKHDISFMNDITGEKPFRDLDDSFTEDCRKIFV